MLNMIKADLYRIFRGKGIYISLAVIVLMAGLSIFAMSSGYIGMTTSATVTEEEKIENEELAEKLKSTNSLFETRRIMKEYGSYLLDKAIIGANTNLYYIFIAIVVLVLVCDLSSSTVKNTLSSAMSRKKYYFAKLITSLLLCTGLILINNYGTYILNLFINGTKFSSSFLEVSKCTILQIPILYGIISLLVCIGFLMRKTSTYTSVTIPLIMVVQLAILGIATVFHLNFDKMIAYEFQYMLTKLVNNPDATYIIKSVVLGVSYIVVFNIVGYLSFRNAEIK